jgi:hypothetical protein
VATRTYNEISPHRGPVINRQTKVGQLGDCYALPGRFPRFSCAVLLAFWMLSVSRSPMKLIFAALFLFVGIHVVAQTRPTGQEIEQWTTEKMTAFEDINCKKLIWMLDPDSGTPRARERLGDIVGAMTRGFVDGAVVILAIKDNNADIVAALDKFRLSPAAAKAHIVTYCHDEPTKTLKDGMFDLFLTIVKPGSDTWK